MIEVMSDLALTIEYLEKKLVFDYKMRKQSYEKKVFIAHFFTKKKCCYTFQQMHK